MHLIYIKLNAFPRFAEIGVFRYFDPSADNIAFETAPRITVD